MDDHEIAVASDSGTVSDNGTCANGQHYHEPSASNGAPASPGRKDVELVNKLYQLWDKANMVTVITAQAVGIISDSGRAMEKLPEDTRRWSHMVGQANAIRCAAKDCHRHTNMRYSERTDGKFRTFSTAAETMLGELNKKCDAALAVCEEYKGDNYRDVRDGFMGAMRDFQESYKAYLKARGSQLAHYRAPAQGNGNLSAI